MSLLLVLGLRVSGMSPRVDSMDRLLHALHLKTFATMVGPLYLRPYRLTLAPHGVRLSSFETRAL